MNIEQLNAFHKIAKVGSFTKAADELFLTQPAVSQQIKALESFFGIRLFERSRNKKVELTREGETLLSYTDRLFHLYEEIKTRFSYLQVLHEGNLTIGSTAVPGTYLLPGVLGRYNRQYPGIKIELRIGNSHKVLDMVLKREVEMGLAGAFPFHHRLTNVFLHRERLIAVASPTNLLAAKRSVSVSDLDKTHFIWREKGTQNRILVERWFRKKAGKNYPKKSIELQNLEATKQLVQEGYGITVLPEVAVRREIEAGLLKRMNLAGFDLFVDFFVFYLDRTFLSKAARAFLWMLSSTHLFSHAENLQQHLKLIG